MNCPISRLTRSMMETIKVDGEAIEVGDIKFSYTNGVAMAHLPSAVVRTWLPAMYEVYGSREFFSREIESFRDTGRWISFTFVNHSLQSEVMRVIVLQLVEQSAQLHQERERARSRKNHPSNGRNLVVANPDRYHEASPQKFTNKPPFMRRR